MGVPFSNLIVEIWLRSRCVFYLLMGLPYPHNALVALHLVVSSSRPVYLLSKWSFFICICRSSSVPVCDADVIRVSLLVVLNVGGGGLLFLLRWFAASTSYGKPSLEWLH